jgi:hypothetical protein
LILSIVPLWANDSLAQDKETRSEIFNAILNDHQLMKDFMNALQNKDPAMIMMNQHPQRMNMWLQKRSIII